MEKLEKILRGYLHSGCERIDVTMVLSLIKQCNESLQDKELW